MTTPSDELVPLRDQGIDLHDEAALGPYDLAGMKASIAAETGGGGGGGPGGAGLAAGGVLAAAALLALGLWGASGGSKEQAPSASEPTPVEARLSEPAAAPVPIPVQERTEPDPPVARAKEAVEALPVAEGAPTKPSSAPEGPEAVPELSGDPVEEGTDAAEPEPVAPAGAQGEGVIPGGAASAGGDLDAQNALFAEGEAALEAGNWAGAGAAFSEYLERWPAGVFRDEALVAVLDLTIRAEQWAHAEALAAELATIPSLAPRHEELRRVRAEALVHLGRCDAALAVAETLERSERSRIRRSCR